jgi:hypothetical protein
VLRMSDREDSAHAGHELGHVRGRGLRCFGLLKLVVSDAPG